MRRIENTSVCVVGGAGFLGSHMVRSLLARGNFVTVIDNLCAGKREFVPNKATFLHLDITHSESALYKAFKFWETQYVFNYAAWPYVPDSFSRPLHVCEVNFLGAIKVINAAHDAGVKGILQVSSAEIYGIGATTDEGNLSHERIDEDCRVVPHSTYGVAKAAVDSYVQTAWKERQTPCIALRQFNCLGERETHPYIVPEIINQLVRRCKGDTSGKAGLPIVRLGNNSFRDFLYAGDAVDMAIELLEKGKFGEVYNLGSEAGVQMYDLAAIIAEVLGFPGVWVEEEESRKRPWEIWHLQSNNYKIHQAISCRPVVPLVEALKRTYAWYIENERVWPWERR